MPLDDYERHVAADAAPLYAAATAALYAVYFTMPALLHAYDLLFRQSLLLLPDILRCISCAVAGGAAFDASADAASYLRATPDAAERFIRLHL